MMADKGVDFERMAREAELAVRLDALILDVVAHAELIAEYTAELFDPVGSTYALDQFLTIAAHDFTARSRRFTPGHLHLALAVPQWVGRFSVLSRTKLPILEYPGAMPATWDAPFNVIGLGTFRGMPSLINPYYDYTEVYPCRAPMEREW